MITTLWFCLIAIMVAGYAILDGFDLGAGVVHLFVARDEEERSRVLRSIGPVWDGNEVWLLAAGGTLYFAFPALYAAAFSGFYLALMMVLWLLILRGIAIELRHHIASALWRPFWDFVFGGSSTVLALLLGVALGNVVRGVPLDSDGYFFLPLWTNFAPGSNAGVVDWYTLLIGMASLAALALHGTYWVTYKTSGGLQERSRAFASKIWWLVLILTAAVTFYSFLLQPNIAKEFSDRPWGAVFPLLAVAGLVSMQIFNARKADLAAFLGSCLYLTGMLTSVVFGVYPYVLPSNGAPEHALTISNASAAEYGLWIGLWWWIPGMLLAGGYTFFVYRHFAGKVETQEN
jgi:cytochrome bd ubiquinol oxidase subunit II